MLSFVVTYPACITWAIFHSIVLKSNFLSVFKGNLGRKYFEMTSQSCSNCNPYSIWKLMKLIELRENVRKKWPWWILNRSCHNADLKCPQKYGVEKQDPSVQLHDLETISHLQGRKEERFEGCHQVLTLERYSNLEAKTQKRLNNNESLPTVYIFILSVDIRCLITEPHVYQPLTATLSLCKKHLYDWFHWSIIMNDCPAH